MAGAVTDYERISSGGLHNGDISIAKMGGFGKALSSRITHNYIIRKKYVQVHISVEKETFYSRQLSIKNLQVLDRRKLALFG